MSISSFKYGHVEDVDSKKAKNDNSKYYDC